MTELDLFVSSIHNIQDHTEIRGARFQALTRSLGLAVVFCDEHDRVVEASAPALRLLALSAKEVAGRPMSEYLGDPGRAFLHRARRFPLDVEDAVLNSFLIDHHGATHGVSIYAHPLHCAGRDDARTMLLMVPAGRRDALQHALASAGSAEDYMASLLLMAREDERKRISSELHDGLGQVLSMLKFKVEAALRLQEANEISRSKALLEETVRELRGAVEDVRRISDELRPGMLDDLGLLPTLKWLGRQFEAAHAPIKVQMDLQVAESSIPTTLKAVVFRLIQEALNNVSKHSRATVAQTYMRVDGGMLVVGIEDNGVGFDAAGILSGKNCLLGVGLNSMRERVKMSNGQFSINSEAGRGTSITAVWGQRDQIFIHSGPLPLTNGDEPHVVMVDIDLTMV